MKSDSKRLQHRWLNVALGCAAIGAIAFLPASGQGQQQSPAPVDVPVNVGATDIGLDEDFSLVFYPGAPVQVNPGKGYRVGRPGKPVDERGDLEAVWTITVLKFETNSHCYTVIIGGKESEVCPQH